MAAGVCGALELLKMVSAGGLGMPQFPVFEGNCPRRVNKDAKYGVRTGTGPNRGTVISLTYQSQEDERWYATTDDHSELVNMVNQVKLSLGLPPNGAFYINEYKQVIVPTARSEDYYLAGTYHQPLRFDFDGKVLSGEPVSINGEPLSPGDTWDGPHPGIPYVLSAGGNDVSFTSTRIVQGGKIQRKTVLSKIIGTDRAVTVAAMVRAAKGFAGGRFFVNEFRTVFAPVHEGNQWRYVYIGQLDLENWFPPPHAQ